MGSFLHLIPVNFLTNPFIRPLLIIGTSVYFIGLLILSSKYYHGKKRNKNLLFLLQIIVFLNGIGSILFATIFDLPFLQSTGPTVLVLWLSIKYFECANWKTTWSTVCSLLGLGALLYGFAFLYKIIFSTFN